MEMLKKIERKEREWYEKLTNPSDKLYRRGHAIGKCVAVGLIGVGVLIAVKSSPLIGAGNVLLGVASLVIHLRSKK